MILYTYTRTISFLNGKNYSVSQHKNKTEEIRYICDCATYILPFLTQIAMFGVGGKQAKQ
jgi:hypothetical protein